MQQLRYSPKEYGGFYLAKPKAGSSGTVDLDGLVAEQIAAHVAEFPAREVELVDITTGNQRGGWCRCCSHPGTATR
ncbi:hypothetical protein [Dactylosporangium darangshiense]|uniref:Uncharacterized protein n=2 Tax=Dactylosporangium darangshiense TaxID=579108 RepID=A0ABP8CVI7_9ACTN